MAVWPIKQLDELCEVTSSKRIYANELCSAGVPFFRSKEIIEKLNGQDTHSNPLFISEQRFQEILRLTGAPKTGDVLLTSRGTLGVPYLVNDADRFHFADGNLTWFRNFRNLDSQYLKYFFVSPPGKAELSKCVIGSSQMAYTIASLKKVEIPLPSLLVQRRIAGILSAYDDLIENSRRRIRLLEAMARALYREWFVHFRFPGHEKLLRVVSPLGEIPHGSEVVLLASLVDFAKGRKPTETRPEPMTGDVKLLLIDSLHGGEAVFTSPAKLVLAGTRDTIMVMDGASSCEVTIGSSGAVGSTLGRFRTTRPDRFSPHALYRFLEARAEEFKSKNIGVAIPHANKDYILTQPVALPSKVIASGFHAQLEPIQCTIEALNLQIQTLRRSRDLLLPRLLLGHVELKPAVLTR